MSNHFSYEVSDGTYQDADSGKLVHFISMSRTSQEAEALGKHLIDVLTPPKSATPFPWMLSVMGAADGTNLPKVYNTLARKEPRAELLVFMHDDVRLWCSYEILSDFLEYARDQRAGVVGVAGSRLLPESAIWWEKPEHTLGSVYHPNETLEFPRHQNMWPGPGSAQYGRALVLDGLFLCCKPSVFEKVGGFDEELGDFHFYDLDFTLHASNEGFENYVLPLPIFHQSIGKLPLEWMLAGERFKRKWAAHLGTVLPAKEAPDA